MNAVRKPEAAQNELGAILDRWSERARSEPVCQCKECRNARALPFECKVCGYTGVPWVWACQCSEQADHHITEYAARLNLVRSGKLIRHPFDFTITKKAAIIADIERLIEKEQQRRRRHRHGDEYCDTCHGYRECPICIGPDREDEQAGWLVVRELRAALAGRGLL